MPDKRSTYSEKLRDPRWQRKRLEVMQRDDFACQKCGAKDKTLNVHHMIYRKGAEPWEYPLNLLLTLCEPCHEEESYQAKEKATQRLLEALAVRGAHAYIIDKLAVFIEVAGMLWYPCEDGSDVEEQTVDIGSLIHSLCAMDEIDRDFFIRFCSFCARGPLEGHYPDIVFRNKNTGDFVTPE